MSYIAIDPTSFRYISHHGILGQKWGVRRYQNPDGSLTAAGKKRKQRNDDAAIKKAEKAVASTNKYIARQEQKLRKKYRIDEISKVSKTLKEQKRYDEAKKYEKALQQRTEAFKKEMKPIREMSIYDIQDKRLATGKKIAGGLAASVLGASVATLGGVTYAGARQLMRPTITNNPNDIFTAQYHGYTFKSNGDLTYEIAPQYTSLGEAMVGFWTGPTEYWRKNTH